MNYTEMLFNRDERLVNLLNQADSKNLELIEELNDREDEIERLNNIINKALRKLRASKDHFKTENENNAVSFTIKILEERGKGE